MDTSTREEFFERYEPIWQYQLGRVRNAIDKYSNFSSQENKRLDRVKSGSVAVKQALP